MEIPENLVARLGEDYNWWVEQNSEDSKLRGIIDPRQVAHLREALDAYRTFGLSQEQFDDAFTFYTLDSELDEGQVRLSRGEGSETFALPVIDDEGDGPYFDFFDALAAARIRKLNATHKYKKKCTEDEMFAELEALDAERYFSAETIHCFDQLNEILEWSPAA